MVLTRHSKAKRERTIIRSEAARAAWPELEQAEFLHGLFNFESSADGRLIAWGALPFGNRSLKKKRLAPASPRGRLRISRSEWCSVHQFNEQLSKGRIDQSFVSSTGCGFLLASMSEPLNKLLVSSAGNIQTENPYYEELDVATLKQFGKHPALFLTALVSIFSSEFEYRGYVPVPLVEWQNLEADGLAVTYAPGHEDSDAAPSFSLFLSRKFFQTFKGFLRHDKANLKEDLAALESQEFLFEVAEALSSGTPKDDANSDIALDKLFGTGSSKAEQFRGGIATGPTDSPKSPDAQREALCADYAQSLRGVPVSDAERQALRELASRQMGAGAKPFLRDARGRKQWRGADKEKLNPVEFALDVYRDLMQARAFSKPQLLDADPTLYAAVNSFLFENAKRPDPFKIPADFYLPTKKEQIDAWVTRIQNGQEAAPTDLAGAERYVSALRRRDK